LIAPLLPARMPAAGTYGAREVRVRTYKAYLFNLNGTLVRARSAEGPADRGAELHTYRRDGAAHRAWRPGPTGGRLQPLPGAVHALRILHKHGRFVAVYTSREFEFLQDSLDGPLAGARGGIDLSLSLVGANLPAGSPQVVAVMRERYRRLHGAAVRPRDLLVVGDALSDLEMARSAGVDFAGVLTGNATERDFLGAGLDRGMIFPSIKDALKPPPQHGIVALVRNEQGDFLLVQEARPGHRYHDCWSGPHGVCEGRDVVEEETVVREVREECGVAVRPLRKLRGDRADTKVETVSFWMAELADGAQAPRPDGRETCQVAWVPLQRIEDGDLPLYEGTRRFFDWYKRNGRGDRSRN
jgi:phosphoglycolate phosphatase-like HAD superfamily hydrolase/ADP-ribose pyrophosphatase YjhB (NUDIX family)